MFSIHVAKHLTGLWSVNLVNKESRNWIRLGTRLTREEALKLVHDIQKGVANVLTIDD
jgi:hypothetical protein